MSRIVTFGEIMGRLAAPGFKRFQQTLPGTLDITFAGAEASVAASIAYMGGEAAFVTALPSHAIADACVADLRSLGVDTQHILRTAQGRLGLYFLETGTNQRSGNVIYDREGSSVAITPPEAYPWANIFSQADWFHISGITPAISRNAAEVALTAVREAAQRGLRISCDMNFRSKLWQWEPTLSPRELAAQTLRGLLPFVDVFFGGKEDAASLLGIHPSATAKDPLADVAQQIAAQFPRMTQVAMTLRQGNSASHNNWGGMLYDVAQKQAFYAPLKDGRYQPYEINGIVDRLGAGDAFAAGLIFANTTPDLAAPQKSISFASAASCLAHLIEGDFNYVTRAEIEQLMASSVPGRLNR
jgi:2-dehydro-3-deoxygluconokinase